MMKSSSQADAGYRMGKCMRSAARAGVGAAWLGALAGLSLIGQQMSPNAPRGAETAGPVFEVASITPVPENRQGATSISPYGSDLFLARNITVLLLVSLAYNMDTRNIVGMPKGFEDRQFDISARAEGHPKLSYEQLQPLLQNLLRDRFHLAVHRSTREAEGYALVVAKGGPKMKAVDAGKTAGDTPYILPDAIRARDATMGLLAAVLSRPVGAVVVDQTGLSGNFDIDLKYRASDSEDSSLPSVFTAIEEQLGLKLVRQRVPTTILVVDHAGSEPTPN